ncbi:PUMP2, partial [Symbiodinium sp. CCMP2456]
VIKTQVQTHTGSGLSMAVVARRVWGQDGIAGFWAGVRPNIARTFLVNAAELGTYDEAKSRLRPHFGDGLLSHVGASGIAGFTSACVSTPADVVKTRLMNCAGGQKQYR